MAISSVGYSGSIGWSDWANMARSLGIDYGVVNQGDLEVTIGNATTGTVDVAAGTAFGGGVFDTLDSTEVVTGLTTPNTWYTIVVRRDWTGGPGGEVTTIEALEGTSARAIAASRQTSPGVVDEQPLALVYRGATALTQVVDLRCWWGNGGARAGSTDALSYLNRPGSVIQVGTQEWTLGTGGTWYLTPVTVDQVPALPASKITSGAFHVDRIPSLPASKVTSGAFHVDRIPSLPASKITSGTLGVDRIPNLPVSKVNGGTWSGSVDTGSGSNRVRAGGGALRVGSTYITQNKVEMGPVTYRREGNDATISAASDINLAADDGKGLVIIQANGRIRAMGVYNSTTSNSSNLHITSEGRFSRSTSSRRYKGDIQDAPTFDRVLEIRPRTWVSKNPDDGTGRHYGVIAEELADLGLEYLITRNAEGQPEGVNYDRIGVALVPLVRSLAERVTRLENRG